MIKHTIHHTVSKGCIVFAAVVALTIGSSQLKGQLADGTYKVINARSGQSLNVNGNGTANGTGVVQNPYDGTTACQWNLTSLGNGQYKLVGVNSGRALTVVGSQGSTAPGTLFNIWDFNGGTNQKFTLVSQPGGGGSVNGAAYYSLVYVHSGLAMQASTTEPVTVNGNPVTPNASLQWGQKTVQNTYDASTLNAQWTFLPVTDGASAGADFAMVVLPDTQCESAGIRGSTPQNFYDQTNWINNNRISKNIQYMAGVGDITQSWGGVAAEWQVAANALYSLDNTVPYGTVPGNHDFGDGPAYPGDIYMTLATYNTWFGPSHWAGKSYYGGNYVDGLNNGAPSNGSHYDLISASGLDFIIVYMAWHGTESPANWAGRWADIAWVNSVLQAHPNRRAIVVSHQIINAEGQFSQVGLDLYNGVKTNANLFLMLCGHVAPCKEATRRDTYNGNTVWTMLADYQDGSPAPDMGGLGILRHLTFKPRENIITSETYSPSTNQTYYRFSIPYRMHGDATPLDTAPAYYMLVNNYSGFVADLIGGNTAEGAVINQWTYDYNSPNQHWALLPTENMDHFKIISRVTGKALSVTGGSTANGAQITDSTYTGNNPAQQWDLVDADAGNGWLNFRNVKSGLLLDHSGAGVNGGKIQQWASVPNNAKQRWRLQPVGNYYIRTTSGNYVSTQAGGTADGTNIVQYTGTNSTGFQWAFQSAGGGYLKVAGVAAPNSTISVAGGSAATGANLNLNTYNAANNGYQKVGIKPQPSGLMKFYFVNDGLNWEVPGDSINLGTVLQQNTDVPNATKQSFLLQRVP